jgi:hypothetical protein
MGVVHQVIDEVTVGLDLGLLAPLDEAFADLL